MIKTTPTLKRATYNSAGYDITSKDYVMIAPGGMVMVGTGIRTEMDEGEMALLMPRSSLYNKYGVMLANSVGLIDADYRDEIKVQLVNMTNERVIIPAGTRIVQLVFANYLTASNERQPDQAREGGFGSTG